MKIHFVSINIPETVTINITKSEIRTLINNSAINSSIKGVVWPYNHVQKILDDWFSDLEISTIFFGIFTLGMGLVFGCNTRVEKTLVYLITCLLFLLYIMHFIKKKIHSAYKILYEKCIKMLNLDSSILIDIDFRDWH